MTDTARSLFEQGKLTAAIESLIAEVRANPTDAARRTFLFELLSFAGEWDRAERQLGALESEDLKTKMAGQVYRHNLRAMRDRRRLFADGLTPHFLSEPPAYVDLHLDAINRRREGNMAEARQTLDRAEEERPALSGRLNGREFDDLRDYDDWTAPVLEIIVQDKYTWLPFEQIKTVTVAEPKSLRDLVWLAARIEMTDSTLGEVYLPALYAGTSAHGDEQARLGRITDWREIGESLYAGVGARTLLAGEDEKALVEIRQLEFHTTAMREGEAARSA